MAANEPPVSTILKVQSPKYDPKAEWLVYGERHAHMQLLPLEKIPGHVQHIVRTAHGRAYFHATLTGASITFGLQSAVQSW